MARLNVKPDATALHLAQRLPHRDIGPRRILDDAHLAEVAYVHDVLHDLRAELLRFPRRVLDIVDTDIRQPRGRRTRHRILHHAAAGALADVDHGIGLA